MRSTQWIRLLGVSLSGLLLFSTGCSDDGGGGGGTPDARVDADPGGPDAEPLAGLTAVHEAAEGTVDIAVSGVYVTYIRAEVGNDPAGFFVQEQGDAGPAAFVAVDPTTLDPEPAVGDEVSLRVTEVEDLFTLRQITALEDWAVASNGNALDDLVQDVSDVDVVAMLDDLESELISLSGTLAGDFGSAGTGHLKADITTAGVTTDGVMALRMPEAELQAVLDGDDTNPPIDFVSGCTFSIETPLWRFNTEPQPSAYAVGDLTIDSCPAPTLVEAQATNSTTVVLTFDRTLDADSVVADGSQFTIAETDTPANTLDVTAAVAEEDGKTVTLTTAEQGDQTPYTVTVGDTLTDTLETAIAADGNSAEFNGFLQGEGVQDVDFPVIAHGGALVISGNFPGATDVTIGDTAQTFTQDNDNQITIASVDDTTPTGAQDLVITTPNGDTPAFSLTVIHLVINELDAQTPGSDVDEFVEISAGLADVSLAGYVLVLFNGNGDTPYLALDLGTDDGAGTGAAVATDENGLLLTGNAAVSPTIPFDDGTVQNGADGAAIYQGIDIADPPGPVTGGLIDALVYDTNDAGAAGLLDGLLGTTDEAAQINEDENGDDDNQSISRCGSQTRLATDGLTTWNVGAPTPGDVNDCP